MLTYPIWTYILLTIPHMDGLRAHIPYHLSGAIFITQLVEPYSALPFAYIRPRNLQENQNERDEIKENNLYHMSKTFAKR